jgi:type IV secretory pathway VirB10-like protein
VDAVVTTQAAWATGAQSWDAAQRQAYANDPFNLLAVGSMTSGLRSSGTSDWLPPDSTFHCAYVARQIAVAAKYGLTINAAERTAATEVLSACPTQPLPEDTAAIKVAADKQAADAASAVAAQAAADQQAAASAAQAAADQQAADQAAAEQAAAQAAAEQAAAEQAAAEQAAAEQAAAAAAQAAAESAAAAVPPPPAAAPTATSYKNCDAVRAAGAAPIHRGDPGYSSKLDRDGDGIGCEN